MRQKSIQPESPSGRIVKNIRRATRKHHSSEEKIRIVLDGLRGESSIAELFEALRSILKRFKLDEMPRPSLRIIIRGARAEPISRRRAAVKAPGP